MGPFSAVGSAFAKAFNFTGRASRSEFWWFFLVMFIAQSAALAFDVMTIMPMIIAEDFSAMTQFSPFEFVTTWLLVLIFFPNLSIQVRRLHDAGFSGFWFLLSFVPFGALVLFILYVLPSKQDTNVWGPPAAGGRDSTGRPITQDAEKRAMQGYACLFEIDREPTPDVIAARKEEISEYYRSKVLKSGQPA